MFLLTSGIGFVVAQNGGQTQKHNEGVVADYLDGELLLSNSLMGIEESDPNDNNAQQDGEQQ